MIVDILLKGILQHSLSETSVKGLTDINALANEYLRLNYHGLRSKDKLFNLKNKNWLLNFEHLLDLAKKI